MLIDLIDNQTTPSIATYVKEGEVTVRLTAKTNNQSQSDDIFEPVLSKTLERLGDKVFSTNNENLQEVVGRLLIQKNITVSTAESCTGGWLSKKLTEVGGISSVFVAGFVTYSNQAKINTLNVDTHTLSTYGAVSSQTAIEMAKGARKVAKTDMAISITGIAGPDGGTEKKPIGLVYIGFSSKKSTFFKELRLSGDREKIRNLTTLHALDIMRRYALSL
jgi:nicotinamide-nucleotide amidase